MTRSKPARPQQLGDDDRGPIPSRYQHAVAVGVLFLSLVIFFHEIIFKGKSFLPPDTIASYSFQTLVSDAKQEGIFPLWNPYIFCGMPGYASATVHGDRIFDYSAFLLGKISLAFQLLLLNPDIGWVLFYYFLFGVGMYFLVVHLTGNKIAALVVAFAAMFSMSIIGWVMAGHMTKMPVLAFFPYILLILEKLKERFSLLWAILLSLAVHFLFLPTHIQMIFYVYFALGIYYLFFLIRAIRRKEGWKGWIRSALTFALASGAAFFMTADGYLSTLEYVDYSIRGSNPIVQTTQTAGARTGEGGLDYDYATNWSFAPGEMTTFFIPSWYGFGITEYRGPLTNNQPYRINTYLGPQPFTHAPQYMGVIIVILAIIGFIKNRKNPFVQYLGVTIVVSLFIAFGKELSVVYDLMYKYFPMFNKFRVPSMILALVQVMVPLLAGYGLVSLFALRSQAFSSASAKKWKYTLWGLGGLLAVALAIPGIVRAIHSSFIPQELLTQKLGSLPPAALNELHSFITNMVLTDLYVGASLLLLTFGVLYLYIKRSLSFTIASAILIAVVVVDLWRIADKPMDTQDRRQLQEYFTPPDYVRFMQQDTTVFRTLEFVNGQVPLDNTWAYWRIQNAHGYHAAKLRAYQDMIDVVGLRNPLLWGLMNVKYIVNNQPDSANGLSLVYNGQERKVYHNTSQLPRAFFVNRYEVASGLNILKNITSMSFDPREVAYIMEDPKVTVEPPQQGARAELLRWGIQDLTVKVTATGNNLLFLSETYYPEGWKATLDGKPTEIYRLNYLFRGVVVPPGDHILEMKFEPRGFYIGKNLSLAINALVLGVLGFVVAVPIIQKKKKSEL